MDEDPVLRRALLEDNHTRLDHRQDFVHTFVRLGLFIPLVDQAGYHAILKVKEHVDLGQHDHETRVGFKD